MPKLPATITATQAALDKLDEREQRLMQQLRDVREHRRQLFLRLHALREAERPPVEKPTRRSRACIEGIDPVEGRITYLTTLLRRACCNTETVGAKHVRLGAARQDRGSSVSDWIAGMTVRQRTTLVEKLNVMIDKQAKTKVLVTPAKRDTR